MVPLPDAKMRVECENGDLEILNFVGPTFYHSIKVRVKDSNGKYKKERVEKAYTFKDGSKGEEWWTTYRYQLEAFVDKLKGRAPQTWMSKEDSVENMKCIEAIYEKVGSCSIGFVVLNVFFLLGRDGYSTEITIHSLGINIHN